MLRNPVLSRLTLLLVTLASSAVCQDPPVPPGGFDVRAVLDIPISFSDGYQTELDLRYPKLVPAPATGWPCAMVLHGGGGSRKKLWVIEIAEQLTQAGYMTLAYDTGNYGVTTILNPSIVRLESERMRDLAEMFYISKLQQGAALDANRLAIMGRSDGGKHALWAASLSGRPLPITSNLVSKMPVIAAIHTDIQVIDVIADRMPQGHLVQSFYALYIMSRYGPGHPVRQMLIQSNYPGLLALLQADKSIAYFPLLRQSDVPLMISYASDDKLHDSRVNADAMPLLKPGVPRRYFQGTGGHGSAFNTIEVNLRRDFTRRWFDRFLKGIQNGIEQEELAEIAILPASNPLNPYSAWQHRRTQTWPIAPSKRLYLRTGGLLSSIAPSSVELGPTIQHRVASGYNVRGYAADNASAAAVLQSIPLVSYEFDSSPVSIATELLGRTVVDLEVVNSLSSSFQLQAALFDVPPTGPPRYITAGISALRSATPGSHRIHIELSDIGYVLPPGHRIRVAIQNMNLRPHPGDPHLRVMPDFEDCDIAVQINPTFPPRIDLPIRAVRAALGPRLATVSAGSGFIHDLEIQGELGRAGDTYVMLLGSSGTGPGFNIPPHIALNNDAFGLGLTLLNTPIFSSSLGVLDPQGNAMARFALPSFVANLFIGYRFSFVGLTLDPSGNISATNPVEMIIDQ